MMGHKIHPPALRTGGLPRSTAPAGTPKQDLSPPCSRRIIGFAKLSTRRLRVPGISDVLIARKADPT